MRWKNFFLLAAICLLAIVPATLSARQIEQACRAVNLSLGDITSSLAWFTPPGMRCSTGYFQYNGSAPVEFDCTAGAALTCIVCYEVKIINNSTHIATRTTLDSGIRNCSSHFTGTLSFEAHGFAYGILHSVEFSAGYPIVPGDCSQGFSVSQTSYDGFTVPSGPPC